MNLKKILSDFGSWIFIGLTFLGFIIIYAGVGGRGRYNPTGDINWYFIGVGIILILPFIIYMIKIKLMVKKSSDENAERINELIYNGDKVIVNLYDIEIKSNSYKQEIEVRNSGGNGTRNEYIDVNHNVIRFTVPYKNELIEYRFDIDMDVTKLKMHFAIKKTTILYVDQENPNNNYLDLRFLEK